MVGWGLFAARDLQTNLFIGVYAAKMQLNDLAGRNDDHYRMELRHKIFDCKADKPSVEVGCVSAKEMGNSTRFLNAMPTRKQLQSAKCQPENAKEDIAVANCTYQHGMFDNVPAQFIVTNSAIKRGEQLSLPYWQFQNNFGLFHKQTGRLMPDVKLVEVTMSERVSIAVKLYLPQQDKVHILLIDKKDFIIALLKNHLSSPNFPVELLHADYIR